MAKVPLSQGAYQARSPIANAQVCINLYPEPNPQDAPFPVTHYPGPGLDLLSDFSGSLSGAVRGMYFASDGTCYAVIGTNVIRYFGAGNTPSSYALMGTLPTNSGYPVSMVDNGTTLVIVDSTIGGWMSPLPGTSGSLVPIVDVAFYGSSRVDFIDTFMVFNRPSSNQFYTTTSNVVTPFDPLYFAAKAGWNDRVVCTAVLHDNIWVFGNTTTEIWYNAGAAAFPFARMPNSILQQGCVSAYSVVVTDNAVYWISQDRWGRNMCMRGEGYGAKRVSTFAVEDEWNTYPDLANTVGMSYQLGGHETIGIYIPNEAWWAYDASTQLWHKRTYSGTNTPWLPSCMAGWGATSFVTDANNQQLAGDRTGPRIFNIERGTYTDAGVPITRQRSWSHVQGDDGQRVAHSRFAASFAGAALAPDTLQLDWSDDAGQTFGAAVPQTIGNSTYGQYQWRRLGYARDRVYRLTWSGAGECALNGAYVDIAPEGT